MTFTLVNRAGKAPRIIAAAGAQMSARVGAHFRSPLEARVLGGDGKPLAGAEVTFALGSGGSGRRRHGK